MSVLLRMIGDRPQRAKQLWRWMYYKDHWVRDLDETHGKQRGFSLEFRWLPTTFAPFNASLLCSDCTGTTALGERQVATHQICTVLCFTAVQLLYRQNNTRKISGSSPSHPHHSLLRCSAVIVQAQQH